MVTLDSNRAHAILTAAEDLARLLHAERDEVFYATLVTLLEQMQGGLGEVVQAILDTSPVSPEEIELEDDWLLFVVEVQTAGSPQQGPNQLVPKGSEVSVRQRRHSTTRTGYVGRNRGDVGNTLTRSELGNNDSFVTKASNLNKFWFDADTNNTFFELLIERKV